MPSQVTGLIRPPPAFESLRHANRCCLLFCDRIGCWGASAARFDPQWRMRACVAVQRFTFLSATLHLERFVFPLSLSLCCVVSSTSDYQQGTPGRSTGEGDDDGDDDDDDDDDDFAPTEQEVTEAIGAGKTSISDVSAVFNRILCRQPSSDPLHPPPPARACACASIRNGFSWCLLHCSVLLYCFCAGLLLAAVLPLLC